MKLVWSAAALICRRVEGKQQILLEWRARDTMWSPIGGKVDEGEYPTQALARELMEELKLDIRGWAIMPLRHAEGLTKDEVPFTVLYYAVRPPAKTKVMVEHIARAQGNRLQWFDLAAIAHLPMTPSNKQACVDAYRHL